MKDIVALIIFSLIFFCFFIFYFVVPLLLDLYESRLLKYNALMAKLRLVLLSNKKKELENFLILNERDLPKFLIKKIEARIDDIVIEEHFKNKNKEFK